MKKCAYCKVITSFIHGNPRTIPKFDDTTDERQGFDYWVPVPQIAQGRNPINQSQRQTIEGRSSSSLEQMSWTTTRQPRKTRTRNFSHRGGHQSHPLSFSPLKVLPPQPLPLLTKSTHIKKPITSSKYPLQLSLFRASKTRPDIIPPSPPHSHDLKSNNLIIECKLSPNSIPNRISILEVGKLPPLLNSSIVSPSDNFSQYRSPVFAITKNGVFIIQALDSLSKAFS